MSLRSLSQLQPVKYMSNAIGSSRESNPSRRICHLRAASPGHVADNSKDYLNEIKSLILFKTVSKLSDES